MNSDKDRILRSFSRAGEAMSALRSLGDPVRQQDAWETLLVNWRQSIELARSYAEKNGMRSVAERRHRERLNDKVLDYCWEARNAEYHDSSGATGAVIETISLNNAPGKSGYIEDLHFGGKNPYSDWAAGKHSNMSMVVEGRLDHLPVSRTSGKTTITLTAPKGVTTNEMAAKIMEFAEQYLREVAVL